jgi:polyisoprenoid-binding protein YceI
MQRFAFLTVVLVLAAPLARSQSSTWVPDKAHSAVEFSILHMSVSNVHGRFGNVSGSIVLNDADIAKSNVNVTIDVSTVDTGEGSRDSELKGAKFFDVAQFPAATFVSTGVARTASGLAVTGNLTLHGVTKPVELAVEGPTGPVTGMDQKPHAGYSATATISRSAFGVGTKFPSAIVGDQVKLNIDLEVVKQ